MINFLIITFAFIKAIGLKVFAGKFLLAGMPPSAPANAFYTEGLGSLYWGTDGFLQDAGLTTAIVKSVKDAEKNEIIYVENNSGFEVFIALLKQGRELELTVVDDSTKIWPGSGGKAMWKSPDDAAAIAIFITNKEYTAAQKAAGERSFKARWFTAFAVV